MRPGDWTDYERSDARRFLDRLHDVSLVSWRDAALATTPDDGSSAIDAAASLATLVAQPQHVWSVWSLADDVCTVVHRFSSAGEWVPLIRAWDVDAIREATERAALALLVRPDLSVAHFRVLYGGFSLLIRVEVLGARGE